VVLVGYGRVGQRIAKAWMPGASPMWWPSKTGSWWSSLRSQGIAAVSGSAADPEVLIQAHISPMPPCW
jgi:CPA2 family monovalent cation:H+ antiporter-2